MAKSWRQRGTYLAIIVLVLCSVPSINCDNGPDTGRRDDESGLDEMLKDYVDRMFSVDEYKILPGIGIEKVAAANVTFTNSNDTHQTCNTAARNLLTIQDYVQKKLQKYSENHVLTVNIPATARFLHADSGKSSFLTGFGMGFLAFGLKKLLLPVFIGAQLIKSVLIAMFLPSILGSLGKIVGKGLSTFSGVSGSSAGLNTNNNNNNNNQVEDFEFKDTSPYNNDDNLQEYTVDGDAVSQNVISSTATPLANSRFGIGNQRISYLPQGPTDSYYMRKPNKKTDYKVFHKIPSSSLLLTSYDPFYSPLLSRLDAVFQQLGLGNDKSPETERCRERLVCMMYAHPAKYAPYSNLVSAQLSRELNELRKPASDNPEILRFFRYMRAAKDGQDGEECLAHGGCAALTSNQPSPAILTTFNEINKLVQARKLSN